MPAAPQHRLLSGLAALALTGGTLLLPTTAWAQTAGPSASQVADAAEWLAGQLSEEGTLTVSFAPDPTEYTDHGRTLDSALALLAAGGQDDVLGRTLASAEDADFVAEYTQGAPFDDEDAAYAGATAKLATVVELTGGDATDVGGVDLLTQLRGLAQPTGRYEDRSDYGDYANLLGHSFALLAFDSAGQAQPAGTVAGLLAAQCPDGGFPVSYEPTVTGGSCSSAVDATGLVLQALAAVGEGESTAATAAVTWLQGQQRADGSFPGEAPVNSTGYALIGLNALDEPSGTAAGYLTAQQNADGGLGKGDGGASDFYATAQALPGWVGQSFTGASRVVARAGTGTVDPTPTPTPSPTPTDPTPTPSPAPTDPTPTDPTPTDPTTPTPGAAEPTPSTGAGAGDGGVAGNGTSGTGGTGGTSGGPLPRTGSDTGTLVSASLALLAAGTGLVAAGASRRRSRALAQR